MYRRFTDKCRIFLKDVVNTFCVHFTEHITIEHRYLIVKYLQKYS